MDKLEELIGKFRKLDEGAKELMNELGELREVFVERLTKVNSEVNDGKQPTE